MRACVSVRGVPAPCHPSQAAASPATSGGRLHCRARPAALAPSSAAPPPAKARYGRPQRPPRTRPAWGAHRSRTLHARQRSAGNGLCVFVLHRSAVVVERPWRRRLEPVDLPIFPSKSDRATAAQRRSHAGQPPRHARGTGCTACARGRAAQGRRYVVKGRDTIAHWRSAGVTGAVKE